MEESKPKRKTYTSNAVKDRYNKKTYTPITVKEKKEIATAYKEKCDTLGIPYSEPLHKAIADFLKEK